MATPRSFVTSNIRARPHRYEAHVTIRLPIADARRRMPWAWDELQPVDERTCEYRTGDDDLRWLAMRVAMFGGEIEVHEPPELREELARWAEGVARAVA